MSYVQEGLQRVADGNGLFISITGMSIVFAALAFISMFIASLPKILKLVSLVFPDKSTKTQVDDDRVAIAIGAALRFKKFSPGKKD